MLSQTGFASNWWVALIVVHTWAERKGQYSKDSQTRDAAKRYVKDIPMLVDSRVAPHQLEILFPKSRNKVADADQWYTGLRRNYYGIIQHNPAIYDEVVDGLGVAGSVDAYLSDVRR